MRWPHCNYFLGQNNTSVIASLSIVPQGLEMKRLKGQHHDIAIAVGQLGPVPVFQE